MIVPHLPDFNFSMFDCFGSGSYGPHLPDCHAAIAMIPSGVFQIDPQPQNLGEPGRFALSIPSKYRRRQFILPAAFR